MSKSIGPIASRFRARPRAGTAVLVGEFLTANPFTHFAAAMRTQGWDVAEVDVRSHLGNAGNRWVNAIADRLLPTARMKSLAAEIEATAANAGADVVLFAKGLGATPRLLDRLDDWGCRSVCWYPDRDFEHPCVDERSLPQFDLFITTKLYHLDHLRSIRGDRPTILIEHGWAPGVHWRIEPPVHSEERPFDVIFVGNHSAYKEEWIADLAHRLPNLKIAIAGRRWRPDPAWITPNTVIAGPLTGDAMSRAIGHARIGLAIHHGPGGRQGWQDDVSTRTFEIPACGTFMLHIDNSHVRSLFNVPEEIDVFRTGEELATKIALYLNDTERREAAAALAYKRVVPSRSYFQIGLEIGNAIRAELDLGRPLT